MLKPSADLPDSASLKFVIVGEFALNFAADVLLFFASNFEGFGRFLGSRQRCVG